VSGYTADADREARTVLCDRIESLLRAETLAYVERTGGRCSVLTAKVENGVRRQVELTIRMPETESPRLVRLTVEVVE
jgi:hypothetical protein